MIRYFSLFLLVFFFLAGCSVRSLPPTHSSVNSLSKVLQGLDDSVTKKEADQLAGNIYRHTKVLTKQYKLVSPPWFHNFLVNIRVKEKGLCYHFSDSLYLYLKKQHYKAFEFHLFGANIGEYWSEHNALLVVAKGCRGKECMDNGILIDAWRDSGNLYFSKLKEDRGYRWKHRTLRCKIR